mmetsp:Transcript_12752/g.39633  ORF Transcript_12752/g.39633 Transcript_12752/m.39633 type:complete len:322 (-) Transcript_12752:311-1276(-)
MSNVNVPEARIDCAAARRAVAATAASSSSLSVGHALLGASARRVARRAIDGRLAGFSCQQSLSRVLSSWPTLSGIGKRSPSSTRRRRSSSRPVAASLMPSSSHGKRPVSNSHSTTAKEKTSALPLAAGSSARSEPSSGGESISGAIQSREPIGRHPSEPKSALASDSRSPIAPDDCSCCLHVGTESSNAAAELKSHSLATTRRSRRPIVSSTLGDLMSLCAKPALCAAASARTRSSAMARRSRMSPSRMDSCSGVVGVSSSSTSTHVLVARLLPPSCTLHSRACSSRTTLGCLTRDAASISLRMSSSADAPPEARKTLTAY